MTSSSRKTTEIAENVIIQLIEWNLYRKIKRNQYAYAILKFPVFDT